jgi:hypothetical protein
MPYKAKSRPGAARATEPTGLAQLTDWVREGTESFFATQRTLLDLVMRQNAHTIHAVRERLDAARTLPAEALTEIAGEGAAGFIAAQRVLLNLAQRQNEILLTATKERTGGFAPLTALTDTVRRGIDNFIDMQLRFLTLAAKETDAWIERAKDGEFTAPDVAAIAKEAMETFVRNQKKFLDVVAEETAHATETGNGKSPAKKTEVTELARQAAEAFLDAQKKLLDVATEQVAVNIKTARHVFEELNPFPVVSLGDLARQTVDSLGAAQKALLDVIAKPGRGAGATVKHETSAKQARSRKRTPRAKETPEPVSA